MVFLARICKKIYMLAPEKRGLAAELFLVLSTPGLRARSQAFLPHICVIFPQAAYFSTLKVEAAGSFKTLSTYLPNNMVSHPRKP
jgi:hypothetical protein